LLKILQDDGSETVKICFIGAGALGSTIGGTLAAGGSEVTLIDTYGAHVEAINQNGLVLRREGKNRAVKVAAATSCIGLRPVDLVIVLVKSYHTRQAIEAALPIIGPDTLIMSLQNGLGHEDILSEVVGRDRLLAGKTYVGGVFVSPGHVIAGVDGKLTVIGELDGRDSERAHRIADEFGHAGLLTQVSTNIMGTIWDKLLINVATGAISGITRLVYGELYRISAIEATALAAVDEAIAVAKALGITLSIPDARDAWLKASAGLPFEFKTSILQSLEKGLPTEIDFINGAVVRQGKKCGIATPVNETLVACIEGIERSLALSAART
jgi:2-dehydropantoate 2-reductase